MQKAILTIRNFIKLVKKKNLSAFSASTAFFLFLSFGPMLAFICTWIPYLPLTKEELFDFLMQMTPDRMQGFVQSVLSEVFEKSTKVMSVAAVLMVWTSGKGTLALIRGLNAIHGVEEKRNYFAVRMIASFYTVVMVLAVLLSLGLIVFSHVILDTLCIYLPQTQLAFTVMAPFRYVVVWLVITMLFVCVYSFLPSVRQKVKGQLPGAMIAATAWSLFSWGFSVYMNVADLSAIYGSLSVLVLALLWLYFGMYIVLLGAYFNQYFGKRPA